MLLEGGHTQMYSTRFVLQRPLAMLSTSLKSTFIFFQKLLSWIDEKLRTEKKSWERCKSLEVQLTKQILGGGFKYFFIFIPTWGKWTNLTNIFD